MKRRMWIAAAAAATLTGGFALAQDSSPSTAELREQIEALQKKVNQIEAREAASAQTQQTAAEVKADADQRSQLVAQPFVAGYNKGFKIQSADGNFVLQPGAYFQFRNITNYNSAGSNDLQNGFEVRRMRLRLDGVMFSKNLRYGIQFDSNRNGGQTTILDAWAQYNFTDKWGIKVGQFRNSWVHEGDVSDTKQLAVERGLLDATLGGSVTDREQGVALTYGSSGDNDDPIQGEVALTDGDNSKNTDFRDADPTTTGRVNGDFGASGRLSYKFFGNWADYADFSAKGDKQDLLVAGAGLDFSENGNTNITRLTADAQYENTYGWSAYGVVHYNYTSGDVSGSDYGLQGQVGYLVNNSVEVFGRYAYLNLDNGFQGEDSFHELTGGVNYFFGPDGAWGHAVKFTVDLNYLPNGSPGNLTGLGYLAGTDDQLVLRAQFQLSL
ncbi:MAG: porin [Tepidisphaeraceae bacterium]